MLDQVCMHCSKMNRRTCLYYQRILYTTQIQLALWVIGRDVPLHEKGPGFFAFALTKKLGTLKNWVSNGTPCIVHVEPMGYFYVDPRWFHMNNTRCSIGYPIFFKTIIIPKCRETKYMWVPSYLLQHFARVEPWTSVTTRA